VRAITITEYGGPAVLRLTEAPDPRPGPGEVLIDVAATSVNRADLLQRQGRYAPLPGVSEILGLECAGTVAELGDGVSALAVGEPVCALLAGGGYAERVAVPAGQVMPLPPGVDLVTAAGVPEVACTVWSNLVTTARMSAGETLLIHGGAGSMRRARLDPRQEKSAREGLEAALAAGSSMLEKRESALDAVEAGRPDHLLPALDVGPPVLDLLAVDLVGTVGGEEQPTRAAHAPQMAMRLDKRMTDMLPKGVISMLLKLPALKDVRRTVLQKTVGETAGGCAAVQRRLSCDVHAKIL